MAEKENDIYNSLLEEQELRHEDEISRNPFSLKTWLNYLNYKRAAPPVKRYILFERSLRFLPRSYKLWHLYLQEREARIKHKYLPSDKRFQTLVNTYERSLVHMNKMPRIWTDYCSLLVRMHQGTNARRAFDRALQALPITQHKLIWGLYIDWAQKFGVEETIVRVFRRNLMFDPGNREEFISYLSSVDQHEEAIRQLSICVDDDHYVSTKGLTKHQLWMKLCDMCADHPLEATRALQVEAVIRSGIGRFSDEVGRLWCRLADFYIKQGQFEKARDIFEEALAEVGTVRDFTVIFDAYVRVEESVLAERIQEMKQFEEENQMKDLEDVRVEVDMRLERLEYQMDQRPLLLNSVVLRQNPHNVPEWMKRVRLFKDDPARLLLVYVEAFKSIDPKLANGKLSALWMSLARHYETNQDIDHARSVWGRAVAVDFRSVDELAAVWCAWAEMELRHRFPEKALALMARSVAEPTSTIKRRKARAAAQGSSKGSDAPDVGTSSDRLFKNLKVWSLYLDLEASLGSVDSCRAAYDRAMSLRVATAQMTLHYAEYLEEHGYFEDSFRVYERAISMFGYPQVKHIWITYLDKFIKRYEGRKLERLRDLFEQAVSGVPPPDAAEIFIRYCKAEERFGMTRHAMAVLDRATRAVPSEQRLDMFRLYLRKVESNYGATRTRPVYERAIGELDDDQSRTLCLEFADMERKLGEVDRARALYLHASQTSDPRKEKIFWRTWRGFEEMHGNEDTFRDMLRVQRSVQVAFSQANYLIQGVVPQSSLSPLQEPSDPLDKLALEAEQHPSDREHPPTPTPSQSLLSLKRKFVSSSSSSEGGAAPGTEKGQGQGMGHSFNSNSNPEELDIDEGAEDEDGERDSFQISRKQVPAAVFGGLSTEN